MRPDAAVIAAQMRAFVEAGESRGPRDATWERAMIGEMEHLLVSGYACALALDSECRKLDATVRELALRIDGDLAEVGELRRVKRELSSRNGELDGLRDLLGELHGRIASRRDALD